MPDKKKEKIPYKEYQILQQKASRRRLKIFFYPWPVLTAILVPAAIFIFGILYYFINIRNIAE